MAKMSMKEKIDGIRKMALVDIPAELNANGSTLVVDQYRQKRIALNMALIQVLIGGTFTKFSRKGTGWNVKFNGKIPNRYELAELMKILETFITTTERPIMDALVNAGASNDDMEIPPSNDITNGSGLPKLEKLNSKKMKEYIFGGSGKDPLYSIMLSVSDCMEIAAAGEALRKKRNMNMMLMAGGIVLLLTGATVAAVCICKHNKKKEMELDELCDDTIDMESDEYPTVDMDDTDDGCPVVKMD